MENGEHCTSTVYKSLLEAKLIKKLSFWVICTPKSFLKHLKRSKLRHTAGTKKGNPIVYTYTPIVFLYTSCCFQVV